MVKKQKTNKWKTIDPGIHGNTADLVSIEELVDYTTIRGKRTYSESIEEDDGISLRKKRRRRKKETHIPQEPEVPDDARITISGEQINSELADDGHNISLKKNKNKNKKEIQALPKRQVSDDVGKTIRGKQTHSQPAEDDNTLSKKKKKKKKTHTSQKRKVSGDAEKTSAKKVECDEIPSTGDNMDDSEAEPDMSAWNEFNLPDVVIKVLAAKKFTKPTEIQALTLPEAIVKKKNVLGAAETGSGKTLAFAIPIVTAILEARDGGDKDNRLWALIVTPTRELTVQVKNHISDLCRFTDIKVVEIIGGLSIEKQTRKLSENPEIVVGTPGRLWELIRMGNEHLEKVNDVKFFVIDEADRMLEKNHFAEFTSLLERMNSSMTGKSSASKRQTLVFSATLSLTHESPAYVFNKKKKGKMKNKSVKVSSSDKLQSFVDSLGLRNPAIIDITKKHVLASGITENCIQCSIEEKDYYLHYLVKIHVGRKIVFCNSINCLQRLSRLLRVLQCNAKILFADIPQNERLKNLENFQKDPNGLLLATDVAARGLDIPKVEYIIHYEVPKTSEIYVHRSGRSVRGVSAEGTSILLISPSEHYHYDKIRNTLGKTEKLSPYKIARPEVFANCKRVVDIGKKIERLEFKMKSVQSNANWMEKCAKEMDILLDDDEMPRKFDDNSRKSYQQNINQLRAELKHLMSKPILPLLESFRYPSFSAVQTFLQLQTSSKS